MESQPQNPQASSPDSTAASTPQAAKSASQPSGQTTRRTETAGVEQVSGLNGLETPERAIGEIKQLGELNSQTGAAGKAYSALSSAETPVQAGQTGQKSTTPEWQTNLQSTLQQGWTSLTKRVNAASPTQLVLGAAAVGAAVWLGTRKRASKADSRKQQTSSDRWSDYPTGSDGSRSDSQYGKPDSPRSTQPTSRYDEQRAAQPTGSQESQTTKGAASGPYGQSNETWQRPSQERWDD